MNCNIKKVLLAGTAIIAVTSYAPSDARAQTELTDAVTITATDVAGVTETNASNTVIIDPTGATTLGADGTESVIMNASGKILTLNLTDSAGAQAVTFADDIVETAGNIALNVTTANPVTFEGNVDAIALTVGSAGADVANTLTFDSANNETQKVAATINAVDAGDTVNIAITSTDTNANAQTFTGAIGGTTAATAVDAITIGQDTTTQMDVTFTNNVNATSIAIGSANGNNAINNVTFGADGATRTVTGTVAGVDTDDTNNLIVAGGSNVTFNSTVGANIDTIKIGADGKNTSATFKDNVALSAITLGAGAGTVDTNTLTLTSAGTLTMAGTIAQGDAGDTNNLNISGGGTVITGGAVNVDTITVTGGTTFDADDNVTGNVNLKTGSIFVVATGVDVTGNVDNTSGTAGQGELILEGATAVSGKVGATRALSVVAIGNGAADFADTVNAKTIDFDNVAGVATFNADVTTNLITFDGLDGEVILEDGVDVSGAIDNSFPTGGTSGAGATAGTLTLNGSSTIAGNVGATNSLTAVAAGATGSTSVFSGNVTAADVVLTNDGAVTFAKNVTVANDIEIADDGIATFTGTAATVSGTVIGGGAGQGSVVVGDGVKAANVTFDSTIGTGTALEGFKVSSNAVANITNNVTVTSATPGALNIDGTLNVDTTAAGITIDNTGAGAFGLDGILNVFGTAANTLTLGSGGTVHVGWNDVNSKLNVRNQVVLLDDLLVGNSVGDAYTINVGATDGVFDPTATAAVNANGGGINVRIADGSKLRIGIDSTSDIALEDGDQITVINSATDLALGTADNTGDTDANYSYSEALAAGQLVIGDTGLLKLTLNTAGGVDAQDLLLDVAIQNAANTFESGSTGVGSANALVGLGAGAGGDAGLDAIRVKLLSSNTETAQNIGESLAPTVDGGFVVGGTQATGLSIDATNMRMASARTGDTTGMVAGEMGDGVTVWAKGFGQLADQDERDGVSGYEADTYGIAVGVDSENMLADSLVGIAASYANTDVDSDGVNATETDIDSYQVSLYGSHDMAYETYTSGMIGYAHNSIDQTRFNVGAVAGNNADADFDSNQFMAFLEAGKEYAFSGGMSLTPRVLANYQHLNFDSYNETGSTANLSVDTDDMDIFELGVGVTAAWDIPDSKGNVLTPSLSAEYRYDVVGDEVQSTANFTGGGATFQTDGFDPDQNSFDIGAGLAYEMDERWSVSADYNYNFKSDYDAHAASLRANYNF